MSIFCRGHGLAGSRQPTRNIQSNIDTLLKRTRHRVTYIFLFQGDILRKAEVCAPLMERVLLVAAYVWLQPRAMQIVQLLWWLVVRPSDMLALLACLPALQQWLDEKWRAPLFLHGAEVRDRMGEYKKGKQPGVEPEADSVNAWRWITLIGQFI